MAYIYLYLWTSFLNAGENTFEEASAYIRDQFLKQRSDSEKDIHPKHIYVHFTCATDTDSIMRVFASVSDAMVRDALKRSGMLS